MLNKALRKIEFECAELRSQSERLCLECAEIKAQNTVLSKVLEDTVALYDITREICKTLDEGKMFSIFKELITKFVELEDCRFLKNELGALKYLSESQMAISEREALSIPLTLKQQVFGFVVARGIKAKDAAKFRIAVQQLLLGERRALLYRRVEEMAITDGLTASLNRRYLLERFNEEIVRSNKFRYKFSILMADIDHFKQYNDQLGHLVGDVVLREVSAVIRENTRQVDLVGRYGGEEFLIILTETGREGVGVAAERIRQAVEKRIIRAYDEDLRVALSIGVAVFPDDAAEAQGLIDKADQALYRAKETGRNRVCIYGVD
ncbi:MAG: GGDEF domain-containing protein [Candidatus Omnitrophota bacterium]